MSGIFISYRRDDSAAYAGRLYDRLSSHFGREHIFMDIDHIEPGEDFVEIIQKKLGAVDVAIVLIGKQWLDITDSAGQRRLDDPDDFVRLEIAAILERKIRTIPVLVGSAVVPKSSQLPDSLAPLVRRNAFEISDGRFHSNVDKFIQALEKAISDQKLSISIGTLKTTDQTTNLPSYGEAIIKLTDSEGITSKNKKPSKLKATNLISIGILAVIFLSGLFKLMFWTEWASEQKVIEGSDKASASMPTAEIYRLYGSATVLIETSWKLIHVQSGKQIKHKRDCPRDSKNRCITTDLLPVYIYTSGDKIEPFLDLGSGNPVGGGSIGSGFVAQESGFILTNRHVAAGWHTSYTNLPLPGILRCPNDACKETLFDENHPLAKLLSNWVPSESEMLGGKPLLGKFAEGRNDYLDITFPRTNLRLPARLARISDISDVALIKVDAAQSLQSVQMDVIASVSSGDPIRVMGYPAISPGLIVKVDSQDPSNRMDGLHIIPEPTVISGNVGKVINSSANIASNSVSGYVSEMRNAYPLAVNAAGVSSSGGPVFNERGHVIGIFSSLKQNAMNNFAVPIKYGIDIMGIQ